MKRLSRIIALSSLIFSSLLLFDIKRPFGPIPATFLRYLRLMAGALSGLTAVLGGAGAILALLENQPPVFLAGFLGAIFSGAHIRRVSRSHDGFDQAFGLDWEQGLPPTLAKRPRYLPWGLSQLSGESRPEFDIPFYTAADGRRPLLCDIWRPPKGVNPSGLAVIYLHGGGWRSLDKDTLTRPFFRQLTAQGHLVMDVAYRLYPEVDLVGMVSDCEHAVAWLKDQAGRYNIDQKKIVLAGGSAGGHLALLCAYSAGHSQLTPPGLEGTDISVRAVVAYYPVADVHAYAEYKEYGPHNIGPVNIPRRRQLVAELVRGASAEATPEDYALFSPINHVHPGCPPTLLLLAQDDDIVPVEPVRAMHRQLEKVGVPAVLVEFPGTEHGFDLALTNYSPAAQSALTDVVRFLLMVN